MHEILVRNLDTWQAVETGPFFDLSHPPEELLSPALPADFLAVIQRYGGREGFLGQVYLRLYRYEELIALNQAYETPKYVPMLFIFGSNGGEEAFAFVLGDGRVVQVPFIPLEPDQADVVANGFTDFVQRTTATGPSPAMSQEAVGHEIHAKKPLVFGGSPTDASNRILVPPAKHAELARWWNKLYFDVRTRPQDRT